MLFNGQRFACRLDMHPYSATDESESARIVKPISLISIGGGVVDKAGVVLVMLRIGIWFFTFTTSKDT